MDENACVSPLAAFAGAVFDGRQPLPDPVRERARQVLMDVVGAIVAARATDDLTALGAGLGDTSGPMTTVLINGTAGVSLELDEGCASSRGHPGVHTIPAAIEAAVLAGATGEQLLRAVVAGYEVAARMGAATTFRPLIHPHGTWGACGAAVAAGVLAGLETPALATAIEIAAALSLAPHYETVYAGATARNLWSGVAGFVGLLAVRAAQAGYGGAPKAPAAVYGDALGTAFDPAIAVAGLGEDWYLPRNYFKLYACCRHAHAAVDAFASLTAPNALQADGIASVAVATYGRAVDAVGRTRRPATPLAAKFSLPYILAVHLKTGSLGPEAFEAPYLSDPALLAWGDRVSVTEEPAYTALLPGQRVARVDLTLADGSRLQAESRGSKGDPDQPLSAAALEEKFLSLTVPVLGSTAADGLRDMLTTIDRRPDVAELARAVAGPA